MAVKAVCLKSQMIDIGFSVGLTSLSISNIFVYVDGCLSGKRTYIIGIAPSNFFAKLFKPA